MEFSDKSIKRKKLKAILESLDEGWVKSASDALCYNLTNFISERMPEVKFVLAWIGFFSGEPDLSQFISNEMRQRQIYLPRSLPDHNLQFILAKADWNKSLIPGIHGIPEPTVDNCNILSSINPGITIILVPGLAFDSEGGRLGRGKGYYDRFLAKPENQGIIKIGVGWAMQILDKIPIDKHDVAMDYVCTEVSILKV